MKNKKFIMICSILILITTISLIITNIFNNERDEEIHIKDLQNKTFKHVVKDSTTESIEEITFNDNSGTKKITIKTNSESIDDINSESVFYYTVNDNIIYIKQADLTSTFKYKKNCIYDTKNPEIQYCIEKDA